MEGATAPPARPTTIRLGASWRSDMQGKVVARAGAPNIKEDAEMKDAEVEGAPALQEENT